MNLLVYDETGSVELRMPLKDISIDDIKPGETVLSLENAATVLCPITEHMYLNVPKRQKYSKIYAYNNNEESSDEVSSFCSEIYGDALDEIINHKNVSKYTFKFKEI